MLRLSGPPAVIGRIAREALAARPEARSGPDGRWRMAAVDAPGPVALVARTTGPHPPHDHLLAIGAAAAAPEGRAVPVVSAWIRPDRPLSPAALAAAGADPRRIAAGRPLPEVLDLLAPVVAGAPLLAFDSDRPARFLAAALRERGGREAPGPARIVAPALRRAGLLPPRGDLAAAAAVLRVPAPETDDPGDHAVALLAVWLRALERGATLDPPAPRPTFDYGRVGFGPELVEEIPARPGVYRFRDREGRLLYVGKAADLRTRVRSYLGHRSRRRRRYPEMMERLWRIEWEETGSELEALLAETKAIRESSPPYNVQAEIRTRRPTGGDLVLFLPGAGADRVELLFLRGGRPAGRLEVDRSRPPADRIRAALRAALAPERPPPEDPDGAEIVTRWLRAKGDVVNQLDLSAAGSVADAVRKIGDCLADPELFTGKFFR